MNSSDRQLRFDEVVMPHLDAAYNLARWLTGKDHDAEDVVQDACMRAFKFLDGFRGHDGRSWLLSIVRNACFTWLRQNRPQVVFCPIDDSLLDLPDSAPCPSIAALQQSQAEVVRNAMEKLPIEFREVLVLREIEGLSYKEISDVAELPIGTVMSRLARARRQLQQELLKPHSAGDLL